MNSSPTIAKLAEALSAAQGEMEAAKKESTNPYFNSKYADLAAILAACREPLKHNQLAVLQAPEIVEGTHDVAITTILMHASGEWISSVLRLTPAKDDPQATGSAISYGRRYAYSAMVGCVSEIDDDGNAASGKPQEKVTEASKVITKPSRATAATKVTVPEKTNAVATGTIPAPQAPPDITIPIAETVEYIDLSTQQNFASLFRESLPMAHRRDTEKLRHHFLGMRGYIDDDGNPTSSRIPRKDYVVVRQMAMKFAKEYDGAMPSL